ncbi:reverse transcriptase domain-containing protein [Tanacetum coccineum]
MIQYLEKVKTLASSFKKFSIKQVPRSENKKADALSKIASTGFVHLTKQVLMEELNEKSINKAEVLAVVEEEGDTWMTSIYEYITEETLLAEKEKARTQVRTIRYNQWNLIQEVLSWTVVTVRWATTSKLCFKRNSRWVLLYARRNKIRGSKSHTDRILLANNACGCKKDDSGMSRLPVHRPVPRNRQQKLTPIMSLWPFYKWGIGMAGHFPEGPGKVKFLIVAIDYFTKWIEAKPVATITGNLIKKFVWDNIVCRFGLPGEIICDNGKQFKDNPFKD